MEAPEEQAVERWAGKLKRTARRLAARVLPSVALAALEMDAARIAAGEIPRLFSRNLRQIDPSLNEDLLELYGVAEQVLSNRFTFFNRSHEFPATIDWRLRESRGWLGELHAFDFALPLGMTYRISGEARYARHLRHLVAHWIAENPPLAGPGWWPGPLARRVRNWILAADLARADWARDTEFLDVVSRSLALQTACLLRQANPPGTLDEIRALLLAGRFFAGSAEILAAADAALALELHSLPRLKTGGHIELAATHLDFLLYRTGEVDELTEALRKALRIVEGVLLADGSLPIFGALSRDNFADVAALAAVTLADPTWKRLAGSFGIFPYLLLGEHGKARFEELRDKPWEAASCLLPGSGYGRLCGEELSALVVNAAADSSERARAGLATFELALRAQRVIVDTAGRLEEDDRYDPRAHNVFLVEGPRANRALGRRATVQASDQQLSLESGDGFARISWPGGSFGRVRHERTWYCLDQRYWVVLDRLEGKGSASGTSLFHFYPTFEIQLLPGRAVARSRVLTLTMIPFGRDAPEITASRGGDGESSYTPAHGIKYPATVMALRWQGVGLPWMGGLVIIPGTDVSFRATLTDAEDATASLELAGKHYALKGKRRA